METAEEEDSRVKTCLLNNLLTHARVIYDDRLCTGVFHSCLYSHVDACWFGSVA